MSETMTRADRIDGIVDAFLDMIDSGELFRHVEDLGGDFEVLSEILIRALAKSLPGLSAEEIYTAFDQVNQRIQARGEARYSELEFNRRLAALGDGLPDHMMIVDVVKLRAEQGDEFALYLLANPHLLDREILVFPEGGIQ